MSQKIKKALAEKIQANRRRIWEWQSALVAKAPPPFYCSIDLRDAGYKIVPVDSNLYPAGFNNICPEDVRHAPAIFRAEIERRVREARGDANAEAKRVMILPESHTSNLYYLENLHYLSQIIRDAGLEVKIGWFGDLPEGMSGPVFKLQSQTQKEIEYSETRTVDGTLRAGDWVPDLVILNNDFSGGYPTALDEVKQPIVPSHELGWHTRKKSEHFRYYNQLATEFAEICGIDPWMITIDTEEVGPVNFNENVGTEEVAQAAARVLERTRAAYEARKVTRKPFAFVKNNSGTYGMGIMVVHDADEVRNLNRRGKNKMSVGKNRMAIESVAVQEGVPTATLVDRLAAEPVIYLVGSELIGGFLRTNTEKGDEDNLNSQGMVFRKLCMSDLRNPAQDEADDEPRDPGEKPEPAMELVYGSIAKISALATGMELAAEKNRT